MPNTPVTVAPSAPGCPFTPLQQLAGRDPYADYEAMRGNGKLVWDASMNGWLVLDYELCRHVELHEDDQFRNVYADADPLLVELKGGASNISLTQGEAHKKLRRFHISLLSPKLLENYRQNIVLPITEAMIRRVLAGPGRADLAAEFGDLIPPRVICALLGMPWQDDELMDKTLRLNDEIMQWIGRGYSEPASQAQARAASKAINELLLPFIRDRRDNPQDDFISRVWTQAPADYGELTEEDALGICRELYLGGTDTTVHGIANALYLLLWNEDVRRAVDDDRDRIPHVIEESLRLYPAPQWRYRIANHDCELGGVAVRKDQLLVLLHAAANRDPEHYGACPQRPDLERQRPSDHLTFNYGPRLCVGAGLARIEMREAICAVLDHLPNVRPDPAAEPPQFASQFMRSYRPLHVVFDT